MTLKAGEMTYCTGMSNNTLHKYCEQGLLAPVVGRRNERNLEFDPRQVPQSCLIKALREMGISQQQIQDYGQNRTAESTLQMFGEYSGRLSAAIASLQEKLDIMQSYIPLIKEGQAARPGIELRALPGQRVHCSTIKTHNGVKKAAEYLRYACVDIRHSGNAGCPLGFAWNDFSGLLENPNQPAQLVSFDPNGPETRPAGEYMVGTVQNYYGEKHSLPQRMARYAEKNDLEFHGSAYMIYLLDQASVAAPEQYLLQIAVGIRRKEE